MNNSTHEEPHWVNPDMNVGGAMNPGYWRQFLLCNDNSYTCGHGRTRDQAMQDARTNQRARNDYLALDPKVM